ncbi:hypothetical protein SAY87_020895 [Trapa incisa]|uniref:Uncharacterized protein n=1 Tax=Trapa incisa TaxID=236973 RepID=A0AAN7JQZ5_9MYRT|nr:hypothetical protein SAY87_020895 [Trapa incisa]
MEGKQKEIQNGVVQVEKKKRTNNGRDSYGRERKTTEKDWTRWVRRRNDEVIVQPERSSSLRIGHIDLEDQEDRIYHQEPPATTPEQTPDQNLRRSKAADDPGFRKVLELVHEPV